MSSAAGRPPPGSPPPAGRPPPGSPPPAGEDGVRRRWRIAIVALVLGVCVASVLAAVALRPPEPTGYGPELQDAVEAACRRSAPDVDDPAAACGCAYQRLAASVPFERLGELEEDLREQGRPDPELAAAVERCRAEG